MKGLFVTFEGIDGAGKTTLSQAVAQEIAILDLPVLWTREPSSFSNFDSTLRDLLLHEPMDAFTASCLVTTSRSNHLYKRIIPTLERGHIVVCDRYIDSTFAYQGSESEEDMEAVQGLFNVLHKRFGDIIIPDVTFLLEVSLDVAIERMEKRDKPSDLLEDRGSATLRGLQQSFRKLATGPDRLTDREGRWRPIYNLDGKRDVGSMAKEVMDILKPHLPEVEGALCHE